MSERTNRRADELAKDQPEQWRKCYPRVYVDTGKYHSPKFFAVTLLDNALGYGLKAGWDPEKLPPDLYLYIRGMSELQDRMVPTFFIAPDFLEAVRQTKPPESIEWAKMHLPFEAAVFMFPRGAVKGPEQDDLAYLWYYRTSEQGIASNLGFHAGFEPSSTYMDSIVTDRTQPELHAIDTTTPGLLITDGSDEVENVQQYREVFQATISLVVRTLLVMLARPEIVVHGSRTGKTAKGGSEFWTPHVIGKHYKIIREHSAAESTGTSPKMHWRVGHVRNQAYGQAWALHKVIWIEPALVNAVRSE